MVSVRFETRATGPGFVRSFAAEDGDLRPADPLDSLAWEDIPPDEDADPEDAVEAPPREDS